jgi:hypothetical protein
MNMKMKNDYNDIYQTSDLACAAALSIFVPLQDVDKQDPRRAYFIFERTNVLDTILAEFQRRELRIEPRAYFDQIKALKTRLYESN